VELYIQSPNTPPRRGAYLKHSDIFTFTFYRTKKKLMRRWKEDFEAGTGIDFLNR
jgi:hypothetical protein